MASHLHTSHSGSGRSGTAGTGTSTGSGAGSFTFTDISASGLSNTKVRCQTAASYAQACTPCTRTHAQGSFTSRHRAVMSFPSQCKCHICEVQLNSVGLETSAEQYPLSESVDLSMCLVAAGEALRLCFSRRPPPEYILEHFRCSVSYMERYSDL